MNNKTLIQIIASTIQAQENCKLHNNNDWFWKHGETLKRIQDRLLPSGSGIDNGTQYDIVECNSEKIVFLTAYHHMNENGFYDGWTEHKIIVRPSFDDINIRITGRDRNAIKDYLHDVFYHVLTSIPTQKDYEYIYDLEKLLDENYSPIKGL